MDTSKLEVLSEKDIIFLDLFLKDYVDDLNYFKTFYLYKNYGELLTDLITEGMEVFDEDVENLKKDENFETRKQSCVFIKGEEQFEEEVVENNEPK